MCNARFLFLLLLLVLFGGCGDSGQVDKAKEQVRKIADKATNALARIEAGNLSDLDGFRMQVRALRSGLATNDFPKARECADQIDDLLETKIVAQSIEFLRLESNEGAQKARAAVADYMIQNNLGETEMKACRELLRHLDELDQKQRIDLVTAIIYIALEGKMSHTAAVPAAFANVIMEELFIGGGTTNSPSLEPQQK